MALGVQGLAAMAPTLFYVGKTLKGRARRDPAGIYYQVAQH